MLTLVALQVCCSCRLELTELSVAITDWQVLESRATCSLSSCEVSRRINAHHVVSTLQSDLVFLVMVTPCSARLCFMGANDANMQLSLSSYVGVAQDILQLHSVLAVSLGRPQCICLCLRLHGAVAIGCTHAMPVAAQLNCDSFPMRLNDHQTTCLEQR